MKYRYIFTIIFHFICVTISKSSLNVETVYLGGVFNIKKLINNKIYYDSDSLNHLMVFLYAINQINDKSDGYYDNLLTNTKIDAVVDWGKYSDLSNYNPNYIGGQYAGYIYNQQPKVSSIIATTNDDITSSIADIIGGWQIPTFITNSTTTILSHGDIYNYNLRLTTSDSFECNVLANIIYYYYYWKKISVIYSTDMFGIDCYNSFITESSNYGFKYLSLQAISIYETDFYEVNNDIKKYGSTIYVILSNNINLISKLLINLYDNDILVLGTQVLSTSSISSNDFLELLPSESIDDIMKGAVTAIYSPKSYYYLKLGKDFSNQLIGLNHSTLCNVTNNLYINNTCILNYVNKTIDINVTDPKIIITYNSVITYAYAVNYLINNDILISGTNMYNYLINSTITLNKTSIGKIDFSSGNIDNELYARGDRMYGQLYEIVNYKDNNFVTIGTWDDVNSYVDCYSAKYLYNELFEYPKSLCYNPIYRTVDSSNPPNDYKETLNKNISKELVYFYYFFGLLIVIENLIFSYINIYYSKTKTIKNSQVLVMLIVNFSSLLGASRIVLGAVNVTLGSCLGQFIVEHLCFRLLFGTLLLKLWRIHSIVNVTSFKRVTISEYKLLFYIALHLSFLIILLLIVIGAGDIKVGDYSTYKANQLTLQLICENQTTTIGKIVLPLIYITELLYIIQGCFYLYKTKAVPPSINETNVLGPAMIVSIAIIVIVGVIILVLGFNIIVGDIVVNVTFGFVLFFGSAFYFINKYIQLYHELYKKTSTQPTLKKRGSVIKIPNLFHRNDNTASTSNDSELSMNTTLQSKKSDDKDMKYLKSVIKSEKSIESKAQILTKYINYCQVLLMLIAESGPGDEQSVYHRSSTNSQYMSNRKSDLSSSRIVPVSPSNISTHIGAIPEDNDLDSPIAETNLSNKERSIIAKSNDSVEVI